MKKDYYLLKTGQPIKLGQSIEIVEHVTTAFGEGTQVTTILMTNEAIPALLKAGIITDFKPADPIKKTIGFYVEKIAKKLHWKVEKTVNYLNTLYDINPSATISIILKEIAIDLDKKYLDYISHSPKIFVISKFNGEVIEVPKDSIKNYKNFAAFRTKEDAHFAYKICKDLLKGSFNEQKNC